MTEIPDRILREAKEALGEEWTIALGGTRGWLMRRDAIASALLAAEKRGEERERERWAPAVTYFERYCQDEADDSAVEWTGCSEEQHIDARAFAAAIRKGSD
jgi:hypothetical protein